MKAQKRAHKKKYFTVSEANATLPLLRSILRDLTALARDLGERDERLKRIPPPQRGHLGEPHHEELQQMRADLERDQERDQERLQECAQELHHLGIELKDPFTGLVDFPSILDDHEVYLCWRLGEPEVAHWHELDAGFAGRRKLMTADTTKLSH